MRRILEGRTAIVTGAGRGVGRAVAEAFASLGARLVVNARTAREIEALAAGIRQGGGEAIAVAGDVGCETTGPRLVEACLDGYGACDILINNASINGQIDDVEDLGLAAWNEVFRVNMTGTMLVCRAAMPQLKKQRSGQIINTASALAVRVQRGRSPYSAAKAAVVQFSHILAAEMKPYGVLVNAVRPGLVDTPMVDELIALRGSPARDETAKRIGDTKKAGLLLTPQQSARLFVWLAAGTDRSGEFIFIDDPAVAAEIAAFHERIGS